MWDTVIGKSKRLLPALLLVPLLASCYLPDRFQSEIRIAPDGSFGMSYAGVMTWVPLYMDYNWINLPPKVQKTKQRKSKAELAETEKNIEKNLNTDKYFTVIEPMGKGAYNVRYNREGKITGSGQATFLRRNAMIINLAVNESRVLTVQSKAMSKATKKQLADIGLKMRGLFRVVTAGKVLKHNADTVKDHNGFKVYDWRLTLASPTPKLTMQLKP